MQEPFEPTGEHARRRVEGRVKALDAIDHVQQLKCGVVFFLHIGKTGGMSVKSTFQRVAPALGWANFYQPDECQARNVKRGTPNMSRVLDDDRWRKALSVPRPRIVAEHHICPNGFREHYLPKLIQLNVTLQKRGCRVVLVTLLRSPVALMESLIFFWRVKHPDVRGLVEHMNNWQVKWILFGHQSDGTWPSTAITNESFTGELRALADRAKQVLSHFDIVGRTEQLDLFISRLCRLLGTRPIPTPHSNPSPRPYQLTSDDRAWIRQHTAADKWLYAHSSGAFSLPAPSDGCTDAADCQRNFPANYCTNAKGNMKSKTQCWSGAYKEACETDEQCGDGLHCIRSGGMAEGICYMGCGGDFCETESDCLASDSSSPSYSSNPCAH